LDLEKKMNTHYLSSLFKPESVVLFGASDKQDSVGGVVFKNLLTSGFEGRIFAINPKRDEVQGQKAFSSLEEIDEVVDLAVVATPAKEHSGHSGRVRGAWRQDDADPVGGL
jgi:acetyltransferase